MQYLTLQCVCAGQDLKRTDSTTLVAGQVAKAIIAFGFTSTEWADMTIYARFQDSSNDTIYDVLMNDEYEVEIPHEVTDHPGSFNVALRAENSDRRVITSDIETFTVIPTIEGDGSTPSEPTETVFQKLAAAADKANTAASNADASRERIEAAEQTRVEAEARRITESAEAVKNANAATTRANDAAKRAEDAASDLANESYPVYNPNTGKYDNSTIRNWLAGKRTGKRYGVKQLKNNVVECEKLWDNAGIAAPTPGKIGTPAVDPYVNEGGPFLKFEVNGGVESDSTLYVAKFQDEEGFNRAHPVHDTCILTPVIWIKHAEFSDSVIDGISDMWHPGWYPCPAALREDGTLQPFMLWAKYPLSVDASGRPRSTSNAKPLTRTVSHNSLINICDYKNSGGGSKTCGDDWYLKIMILMKYGTKDSQKYFASTTGHSEQVRPTIEENGVKRVIIATSEANKFPIGSAMMFGTNTSGNNDRGQATSYDIFDDVRITKIEKYDDSNSAVYFDTEQTFDTKTTYLLSTSHWWCGACDEVEGDGSPYNPKSGREPFTIQGIEVGHGFYEIIGNMILKSVGSGWKIYVNYNSLNEATSVTSNYTDLGYTYPAHTTDGWIYPQYLGLTLGVMITKGIGASTSSGVCDGTWLYKDSNTGEMEWQSLGLLWGRSDCGVSCVYGRNGLGSAWWSLGGRRSYMSRSLVPTEKNLKKAA